MKNSKKGFSLVELLVVIAIIMVLIALLLPMTLRLEDAANLMIDISNFRKIYGAMYAFSEDHKGHIPHMQTNQLYFWHGMSYEDIADKLGIPYTGIAKYAVQDVFAYEKGTGMITAYKEYVSEDENEIAGVFNCPSPRASRSYYSTTNYDFRLTNGTGSSGIRQAPPGGWVIGTHNPRAHIVQDDINTFVYVGSTIDKDTQKRSPFDLKYYVYPKSDGTYDKENWTPYRHMGNRWPRLRLDGSADVLYYDPWWGDRGSDRKNSVIGGWFPGSGGI